MCFVCFPASGLDIESLSSWLRVSSTAPAQDGIHWPLALEIEGLRAQSQVCHYTIGTEGEKRASVLGARNPKYFTSITDIKIIIQINMPLFCQI